ncbi:putative metallopeptidase [Rhizobium gallicum]|uniref:putative metallopeptidase n=1 Tax=Rhizobium gallicum TaxID=56730 RepID=UPI0023BA454A|nr:putative metallopeptidase [Rhizobium gallicum]
MPHFLLTFDAHYASTCSDAEFCALVEHELYHAGQERDAFGAPKFRRDGSPAFGLRGHDVEEFVGVVRRYGADAAGIRAIVDAPTGHPRSRGRKSHMHAAPARLGSRSRVSYCQVEQRNSSRRLPWDAGRYDIARRPMVSHRHRG